MQHITTTDGVSYIKTFPQDVGNDLGLAVNSLYYYDPARRKYVKSSKDVVDVLNIATGTHEIPKSRVKES